MTELISLYFSAIILGVWSFLFAGPLTEKDEIFHFVVRVWERFADAEDPDETPFFEWWIAKITYYCAKCHAGFWGLTIVVSRIMSHYAYGDPFDVFHNFSWWVISVFMAYYLSEKLN